MDSNNVSQDSNDQPNPPAAEDIPDSLQSQALDWIAGDIVKACATSPSAKSGSSDEGSGNNSSSSDDGSVIGPPALPEVNDPMDIVEDDDDNDLGPASTVGYAAQGAAAAAAIPSNLPEAPGAQKLELKSPYKDMFLHSQLSEGLIDRICDKKAMTDEILGILNPEHSRLTVVKLKDASKLTLKGLRTLKGHKIQHLEAVGLINATVTDLIGCLGDWSLLNLKTLNVSRSTFVDQNKVYVEHPN